MRHAEPDHPGVALVLRIERTDAAESPVNSLFRHSVVISIRAVQVSERILGQGKWNNEASKTD
jgi:hypothetical protein